MRIQNQNVVAARLQERKNLRQFLAIHHVLACITHNITQSMNDVDCFKAILQQICCDELPESLKRLVFDRNVDSITMIWTEVDQLQTFFCQVNYLVGEGT